LSGFPVSARAAELDPTRRVPPRIARTVQDCLRSTSIDGFRTLPEAREGVLTSIPKSGLDPPVFSVEHTAIMIRILLVDDHDLFRAGLSSILREQQGMLVIGEYADGEQAVEAVRKDAPDLILMDVNMPGMGGLEATRKILQIAPQVKVIAVTVLSEDPFPNQLLDAGARGYISKGSPSEEMLEAIRMVMRGRHYISSDVAQKLTLANFRKGGEASPLGKLTAREMQVMMMITSGQSTQDISDTLFLSPKTVSTYRHRVFEKLDVSNDVELTHLAIRHGLLENTQ